VAENHDWCDRAADRAVKALGVIFVLYVGFVLSWRGDDGVRGFVGDLGYVPVALLAVLLGIRVINAGVLDRRSRRAWAVLLAGIACQLVAHASWFVEDQIIGDPPYPAFADYWFLAFPLVMIVGLLMLPGTRRTRGDTAKLALDALTIGVSMFMVLWHLLLGQIFTNRAASIEEIVYAAALPTFDLLLVAALSAVMLRRGAAVDPSLRILALAMALFVVADVNYAYVQLHAGFMGGTWPDCFWFAGSCLLAVAAHVRHRQGSGVVHRTRLRGALLWLPYGFIALAYGLLLEVSGPIPLFPLGGMIVGAVLLTSLVVARQMYALRENRVLAVTDPLTGLANRALVAERLARLGAEPLREGRLTAVLVIDLDRFKPINDKYGHEAGDAVLAAAASALRSVIRAGDVAGRLGGDEFAVLLQNLPDAETAERIGDRLVEALRTPVVIGEHVLAVEASVGIALREREGLDGDGLLARADAAMYAAKRAGRGTYRLWTPELDTDARDAELRRAVENDELVVHFQPGVDLGNGRILSVEALVRWDHPERGLLMPGEFIELAEETGAVVPLGEWVLRESCRRAAAWHRDIPGASGLFLNVNLSPKQVVQPGLVATIRGILDETGFPADRLCLELTEGVVLEPDQQTVARLESLRALGVTIAVDDFGTGYSALSYLRSLPVDVLKIDRSFVTGIEHDADARTVAEAVVRLGMAFRMLVVAEGVETDAQARVLRAMGCAYGQGYHFYRPLPPEAAEVALREAFVGA
jgi:diguanylate cyclase